MECGRGRYEKRVAGKSLDLTVTLVIGDRIWSYSWDTLYEPCCDARTRVVTGKPEPIRSYSVETGSPAIIVVFWDYSLSPS